MFAFKQATSEVYASTPRGKAMRGTPSPCSSWGKYPLTFNIYSLLYGEDRQELECGPMANVMAALPNIGGALCESSVIPFLVRRRKVWLTPAAGVACNNAANTGERKTWT